MRSLLSWRLRLRIGDGVESATRMRNRLDWLVGRSGGRNSCVATPTVYQTSYRRIFVMKLDYFRVSIHCSFEFFISDIDDRSIFSCHKAVTSRQTWIFALFSDAHMMSADNFQQTA